MNPLNYGAEKFLGTQIQTAQTWGKKDIKITCDAVIIGAGPGGLTTASVLAEQGLDVVVLEGGNFWRHKDFKRQQSWALRNIYQDQGTRVMQGNTFIPVASGRGVGGGTLVNSGISFRAPDHVLEEWKKVWNVDFWEDSDALYSEVEAMIGAAPTSIGIAGVNTEVNRRGFQKLGVEHAYMPRNTPGCVGCGTCQTGCPSGGKASADHNWLPKALKDGARLFANVRIEKILTKGGRATGVRGVMRNHDTKEHHGSVEIMAGKVILAAGAINTPLLLLTNGLANSSGWVGRNLHVQPGCGAIAKMEEEVRIWSGATQGYFAYHPDEREVLLESFSAPPEAFFAQVGEIGKSAEFARELKHYAACGFLIRDSSAGTLSPADGPPNISYSVNEADRRKFIKGVEKSTEMFFAAGSKQVRPLIHGAKFFTSFNEARQFIRGASVEELLLYSSHPMGTCRIGTDPTKCVVRPEDGRTHDVEGLYITDSSLHPTAIGANPQMTIMASSLALARRMAKN